MKNVRTQPVEAPAKILVSNRPTRRVTRPKKGRERVTLRAFREAMGKTQVDVAEALEIDQGEVSRIERRPDLMLSTLRRYASALDAACEITFVLSDGRHVLIAEVEPPGVIETGSRAASGSTHGVRRR
jgi:DNA-binding XRE family transcriptional regulator